MNEKEVINDDRFNNLKEVALKLIKDQKKVNLLYAFNGTGKTRLSTKFINEVNGEENEKVLYFNAFIEDLFTWNNNYDENDSKILNFNMESSYFKLIEESGKEKKITELFQEFTQSKIEPQINFNTGEISFYLPKGRKPSASEDKIVEILEIEDESISNIKISRGEESIFIWSLFYILVEEVIEKYNMYKKGDSDELGTEFSYIFIDDPVSSLDDSHLMSITISLANLIGTSEDQNLRFVITTHHALFFNVMYNSFKSASKYILKKVENAYLLEATGDSPFAYHLEIKRLIENAIENNNIQKYHFTLLRNLLERTAAFLGYKHWSNCITLPNRDLYEKRINGYSHYSASIDEYKYPDNEEIQAFKKVFNHFIEEFKWYKEVEKDEK